MTKANPYRGEGSIEVAGETLLLRPSFGALIAAEEELGSLFEVVERAAEGALKLSEIAALFDHLSKGRPAAGTRGTEKEQRGRRVKPAVLSDG